MRAFVCRRCRNLVRFEALMCPSCGALTGFNAASASLETLQEEGRELLRWSPTARARAGPGQAQRWRRCSRWQAADCNWLVVADEPGQLCPSCRLTRARPVRPNAVYRAAFAKAEVAKRRLLFQLGQLGLPVVDRQQDPEGGLAFDLLASSHHVVTGHDNGIITIDLNETDDVFREQARAQFGEPYRTLLGHFRHEIGHYYWRKLVAGPAPSASQAQDLATEARALFGDDLCGYDDAKREHYAKGPAHDWQARHVSAYASMHPLEDWAETFAHYLHIWDTVQTAASFGVLVTGPVDDRTGRRDPANASVPSEDTATLEGFDAVIADWRPLTVALNALNRSLGKDDLYPFELSAAVVAKLAFVHKVITSAALATDKARPTVGVP